MAADLIIKNLLDWIDQERCDILDGSMYCQFNGFGASIVKWEKKVTARLEKEDADRVQQKICHFILSNGDAISTKINGHFGAIFKVICDRRKGIRILFHGIDQVVHIQLQAWRRL